MKSARPKYEGGEMIFILLTRLIGKEVHPDQFSIQELKQRVSEQIASNCPEVVWISNYALFGAYDYLDIFRAPDIETAMQVAMLVRSFGEAATEVWPALEWKKFDTLVSKLPEK
jgi:uncharacterized protein with GYD domain